MLLPGGRGAFCLPQLATLIRHHDLSLQRRTLRAGTPGIRPGGPPVATLKSWWTRHPLEANTGAQSDTGDWVSIPSDLVDKGARFATFFVPVNGQRVLQAGPLALHAAP